MRHLEDSPRKILEVLWLRFDPRARVIIPMTNCLSYKHKDPSSIPGACIEKSQLSMVAYMINFTTTGGLLDSGLSVLACPKVLVREGERE